MKSLFYFFFSLHLFLSLAAVVLTSVSVVCYHFWIVCVGLCAKWAGLGGGCMMFDSMLTGLTAVAKHD